MAQTQKRIVVTSIGIDDQSKVIIVDTAETETHNLNNTVTDHPVEEGFNVSDHSRPDPEAVQLDCIVSNTPLSQQQAKRIQIATATGTTTIESTATAGAAIGQSGGYADKAYQQLKEFRNKGTLLTVVTGLEVYKNMSITNITIPRSSKTFDALKFTVSLKRIRVVQNQLTRTTVAKDTRAGSKVKTGTQVTKPADDNTSSSILKNTKDVIVGALK